MKLDRTLLLIAVIVVVIAAAVGGVKMSRVGRGPKAPAGASGTLKLLVVGIEGLEISIVERLSAEGRLPNLTRMMEEGATGEFESLGKQIDQRISWTSLATGVSPENQGIGGKIVSHRGDVVEAPLTPEYRTVGTIWTALSDAGSGVGVLSWPGTWPVEPVNGVMIGPYEHYYLEREHQGNPLEAIHPIERHEELDPLIVGAGTHRRADLARFLNLEGRLGFEALIGKGYETLDVAVAGDRSMAAVARYLATERDIENVFVCLDGLEDVSQRFWHYSQPDVIEWEELDAATRRLLEGQIEALGVTIDRYYEFVDELVGELAGLVREDGLLVVVTDHGYEGLIINERGKLMIQQHMHSESGLWIMRGPGVASGVRVDGGSLLDFAPTVMEAAGISVPEAVEGSVVTAALAR
jgi:predicted AlkP superfamily phosphohydrolase/phosphomutase